MEASPASHLPERRKELGAFYTPPAMAAKLAEWAIRSPNDRVLDPSFGGLAFLRAAADRLAALGHTPDSAGQQLHGVDLDAAALEAATVDEHLVLRDGNLVLADFFAISPADLAEVEVLLGNPPYIRYQGFNGSADRARELAAAEGVRLTKLASSWAPFVVHGASFIAPGGRMAQVLPAELLHAQYAGEVLEFLRRSFGHIAVAVFEDRAYSPERSRRSFSYLLTIVARGLRMGSNRSDMFATRASRAYPVGEARGHVVRFHQAIAERPKADELIS